MDGKGRQICRIRKRGCSSSSSSSLAQKYRFKRAILVGKRTGLSTPVPAWKTEGAKSPDSSAMPTPIADLTKDSREVSVSSRKLAATLWEIDNVKSPDRKDGFEAERDETETRNRAKVEKMTNALPPHLSDPSYYSVSEKLDRQRLSGHRRKSPTVSQKLQVADFKFETLDSMITNDGVLEIEAPSGGKVHNGYIVEFRTRLKDVVYGLTTSKELLKVLNNICHLEQQNPSSVSLVSALRFELDRARKQVNELIREQRSYGDEIEHLLRHFAEKKAAWKRGERQRIRESIECIAEELEVEKKLRRQTERLNKKLGKELADTKELLSEALKDLESQKREKDILEQVCEELAKGIGDNRAEVEEMKRESAKVREEVEKEREMLQLADVLREERVQMKLSEARYHFEEKNAALEKLRNELEDYLRAKKDKEKDGGSPNLRRIKELEAYLKSINFGSYPATDQNEAEKQKMVEEEEEEECEDDSTDSDLHSIELNMDNHDRSYKWSYAYGDSKRNSVDKKTKGRRSLSDKIPWGSICFEGGGACSDSIDWELGRKSQEKSDGFLASEVEGQDNEEIKRYKSVKSLRDHILSSKKIAPVECFSSPAQQPPAPGHPPRGQDSDAASSPVLKEHCFRSKPEGKRGERRISTSSRE